LNASIILIMTLGEMPALHFVEWKFTRFVWDKLL